MRCRHAFRGEIPELGPRQQVDVKMNDGEVVGAASNAAQHVECRPEMIMDAG